MSNKKEIRPKTVELYPEQIEEINKLGKKIDRSFSYTIREIIITKGLEK